MAANGCLSTSLCDLINDFVQKSYGLSWAGNPRRGTGQTRFEIIRARTQELIAYVQGS